MVNLIRVLILGVALLVPLEANAFCLLFCPSYHRMHHHGHHGHHRHHRMHHFHGGHHGHSRKSVVVIKKTVIKKEVLKEVPAKPHDSPSPPSPNLVPYTH